MGRKAFRKILALLVMVFGAVTVFTACSKNPYKKMKLTVDQTEINIVYDEESDNTFSLTAKVSGVGKKVSKDVEFVIEDKSVVLPIGDNYAERKGKTTTATFYATKTGGPTYITVRTIEGNKSQRVKVNVVIPIKNMAFNLSTLPIERNVKTDITTKFDGGTTEVYNRITYTPSYTTQKDVLIEVVGNDGSDLTGKVQLDGNNITVIDNDLESFKLKATSVYNENLVSTVDVDVLDTITSESIVLKQYNSSEIESTAVMPTIKENGVSYYYLDLANMDEAEARKVVYADYKDNKAGFNDAYTLTYSVKDETKLPFNITSSQTNRYTLDTGFGTNTGYVNFLLNYKGYEQLFAPKLFPVKVNVSTFPNKIYFTEPGSVEEIDALRVFKNYNTDNGYFGAKTVVNIKNGDIIIGNQAVRLTVIDKNTQEEIVNGVQLFTMSANNVRSEITPETHVKHGTTVYITYNYNELSGLLNNPNANIVLYASSVVKNTIIAELKLNFVKGDVYPSLSGFDTPSIEIAKGESVELNNTNLDTSYINLNEYKMTLAKGINDIVSIAYDDTKNAWVVASDAEGRVGSTSLTISTPNGYDIKVNINVFEKYTKDNIFFRIEGQDYDLVDDPSAVVAMPLNVSTNSGFSIQLVSRSENGQETILDDLPVNLTITSVEFESSLLAVDLSGLNISTTRTPGISELSYVLTSTFFKEVTQLYISFEVKISVRVTGFGVTNELGKTVSRFDIISTESIHHEEAESKKYATFTITSYPSNVEVDIDSISWNLRFNGKVYNLKNYSTIEVEGLETIYSFNSINNAIDASQASISVEVSGIDGNKFDVKVYCTFVNNFSNDLKISLTLLYSQTYIDINGGETPVTNNNTSVDIYVTEAVTTAEVALDKTTTLFNLNQLGLGSIEDGKQPVEDETRNKLAGTITISTNSTTKPSFTDLLVKGLLVYYSIGESDPEEATYNDGVYYDEESTIAITLNEDNTRFTIEILAYKAGVENIVVHFVPKDSINASQEYTTSIIRNSKWGHITISFRNGTQDKPYRVADAYDLQYINNQLDAWYEITNNIHIPEKTKWTPIGANVEKAFVGHIFSTEGQVFTISGLQIVRTVTTSDTTANAYNAFNKSSSNYSIYYGLFGYVGAGATLQNFNLEDVMLRITYSGDSEPDKSIDVYMGALAGYSEGLIENVDVVDDPEFEYDSFNGTSLKTINATKVAEEGEDSETYKRSLVYLADNLGDANANNLFFGGVVGANAGEITDITAKVTLHARDQQANPSYTGITTAYIGGLAGINFGKNNYETTNDNGLIENANVVSLINASLNDNTYKAAIFNPESVVGGVVGVNASAYYNSRSLTAKIQNTTVRTLIFALNNVGGVAGFNYGLIDTVTVQPTIIANKNVGGVAGVNANLGANDNILTDGVDQYGEDNVLNRRFVVGEISQDIHVTPVGQSEGYTLFVDGSIYHTKVQFVDRMDNYSFMNTSIMASENVGGIVGYNYDRTYANQYIGNIDKASSRIDGCGGSIAYTSVNSYFIIGADSPIASRVEIKEMSADEQLSLTALRLSSNKLKDNLVIFENINASLTGDYYGDIVILPNISGVESNVYAGGIIGKSDGLIRTNDEAGIIIVKPESAGSSLVNTYANLNLYNYSDVSQAYTAYKYADLVYGGVVGKAKGLLFVYNANVMGNVLGVESDLTGGFVGDATEILDRVINVDQCTPYAKDDGFYTKNMAGSKFSGNYNINNSYTLLKNADSYVDNFTALGQYTEVTALSGQGLATHTMKTTFDADNSVNSTYTAEDGIEYTILSRITANIKYYIDSNIETLTATLCQEVDASSNTRYVLRYDDDKYRVYTDMVLDTPADEIHIHLSLYDSEGLVSSLPYQTDNIFHLMANYILQDDHPGGEFSNNAAVKTQMNLLTASNSFYVGFKTTLFNGATTIDDVEFSEDNINKMILSDGTNEYSYYPNVNTKWHYTNLDYKNLVFDQYLEGSVYHFTANDSDVEIVLPDYANGDILIQGGDSINPSTFNSGYNIDSYQNKIYIVEDDNRDKGLNATLPSGQYLYYNSTVNGGIPLAFGKVQVGGSTKPELIIDLAPANITVGNVTDDDFTLDKVVVNNVDNKTEIVASSIAQPLAVIVEKLDDGDVYGLIAGLSEEEDPTKKYIVDIKALPEFVGYNSIKIVSSDERVARIEKNGDVFDLVTTGIGNTVLTITSELNNSLKQEIILIVRDKLSSIKYEYITNSSRSEITDGATATVLKGSNTTFEFSCVDDERYYAPSNMGIEYTITGASSVTIDGIKYDRASGSIKATLLGFSHVFRINEDVEINARPFFIYTLDYKGTKVSYRQYLENIEIDNIDFDVNQTSFAYNIYAPNNMSNGVAETATFEVLVSSNDDLLVPINTIFTIKNITSRFVVKSDDDALIGFAFYNETGNIVDQNADGEADTFVKVDNVVYEIVSVVYDSTKKQHAIKFASYVDSEDYQYITNQKDFEIKFEINNTYDGLTRDDKFNFTVLPFAIEDVRLAHYTRFFDNKEAADNTADSSQIDVDYRSYKYASDKIVPGYNSLFEIRVTPYYAEFDYITVEVEGDTQAKTIVEQLLEGYSNRSNPNGISHYYRYDTFDTINDKSNYIRINSKYSYFIDKNAAGETIEYDKNADNFTSLLGYDGLFYLSLALDSSFEGSSINVVVKGFRSGANGDIQVFEKNKELDVVGIPRITASWDNNDSSAVVNSDSTYATINLGGKLPINLAYSNTEDLDYKIQEDIGELEYIDGKYIFNLNNFKGKALNSDYTIEFIARNVVDGVEYITSTTLRVRIVPFLVKNIFFKDLESDNYTSDAIQSINIHFNHTKDIYVGINAEFNATLLEGYYIDETTLIISDDDTKTDLVSYIQKEITLLEIGITSEYENDNNKYIFKNVEENVLEEGNFSTRGYEIGRGNSKVLIGATEQSFDCFTITISESRVVDKFLAFVSFDYNTVSGKPIQIYTTPDDYSATNLNISKTAEVSINVLPLSDGDNPLPIKSVDDLRNMRPGVSYILLNDLVLTNWVPIEGTFKCLDGNGYTITLTSFGDLTEHFANSNSDISTNVGIFSYIGGESDEYEEDENQDSTTENETIQKESYVPTVKNLTIDICPIIISTDESTPINVLSTGILNINIGNNEGINFGVLAGTNNGVVTNVNVVNNASDIRQERRKTFEELEDEEYTPVIIDTELYNTYFASDVTEVNYSATDKINLDLYDMIDTISVVTENSQNSLGLHIGGLVGINTQSGYITNSSVENVNVKGSDYVAGFVSANNGYISSSFFKGGSVISNEKETKENAITAGFVAENKTGKIQYCYVLGAETKDVYGQSSKDTYIDGTNDMLYINNNSSEKLEVNISNYAGYKLYEDVLALDEAGKDISDYLSFYQLRALGSVVYTNNYASGFVGENNAYISNSYSNIVVYGTYAAGFTINNTQGEIEHCYTMSSIENSDNTYYPFARNSSKLNDCFYMTMGREDNLRDASLYDAFTNASTDKATSLTAAAFQDYNTFTAWAFNSDYSTNVDIVDGVWFIPQATTSTATLSTYNNHFKENNYMPLRPELVSANLRTVSLKYFYNKDTGDGDTEDLDQERINWKYIDVNDWYRTDELVVNISMGSVNNPLLIKTAEDFNLNCATPIAGAHGAGENTHLRFDAVRMVSDISFNNKDQTATTYNTDYSGNFEGNGLTIKNLKISADNNSAPEGEDGVSRLGLFRRITSRTIAIDPITEEEIKEVGNVRNLNINIVEINGSNVNLVGVLAGAIDTGRVYNITINDDDNNVKVEGLNAVGGLAGMITGDSEIVNVISNVSVQANSINNYNTFSYKNPNKANTDFKMFVSSTDTKDVDVVNDESALADTLEKISYVGGIAGIIDVNENPTTNSVSNIDRIDRIRQSNVSEAITLSGEVVGGIAGYVGNTTCMSSCTFNVCDTTQINATRIGGGVVGHNMGYLNRIAVRYENQDEIDGWFINSKDLTANDSSLYNKYDNPTSNSEDYVLQVKHDTFTSNAHYIGGVVGANIGGIIENSYSRINVINVYAQYAGGVVGLNIAGEFNQVYTTGSVYAFYAYGGIIGYQPYIEITGEGESEKYVLVDELSLTGKKLDSYIYNLKDVIFLNLLLEIAPNTIEDWQGTRKVISNETKYTNVVGANIWRRTDLNTNRSQYYGGHSPAVLGTFVGYLSDTELIKKNGYSSRFTYENTFFKQTYRYSNASAIVPEIGNLGLIDIQTEGAILGASGHNEDTQVAYKSVDGTKLYFVSGDYTLDELTYRYSRVAYYGSLRTLNELISRTYIIEDNRDNPNSIYSRLGIAGHVEGGKTIVGEWLLGTGEYVSNIYRGWNAYNWNGVRLGENNTIYNDIQGEREVFPELVNNIQPAYIYVYTEEDLMLMNSYRNATFILQNDIELTTSWSPVGDIDEPFTGELRSAKDDEGNYENYTIKNLSIAYDNLSYFGFVAVASGANFHHFKVEYSNISCNTEDGLDTTIGGAVLVGYAKNGDGVSTINNVELFAENSSSVINIYKTQNVGGIVGIAEDTSIYSCKFTSSYDTKFNSSYYYDKDNILSYNFGVVAGDITAVNSTRTVEIEGEEITVIEPTKIEVSGLEINIKDNNSVDNTKSFTNVDGGTSINIGGVYGRITGDCNIYQINIFDVDMNILFNNNKANPNQALSLIHENNINIGGVFGTAEDIIIDDIKDGINTVDDSVAGNTISYTNTNSMKGGLNIGGIIGLGQDINYGSTIVKNKRIEVEDNYFDLNTTNNIGGVFGNISNANVCSNADDVDISDAKKIEVFNSIIELDTLSNFENIQQYNIGGIAGISQNATFEYLIVDNGISEGLSSYSADYKSSIIEYKVSDSQQVNIGGLLGTAYNSHINKGYALGDITSSEDESKDAENMGKLNVGGIIGRVDIEPSGENTTYRLDEVASDVDIFNTQYKGSAYSVMSGGLIGKVENENIDATLVVANSYAVGKIYSLNNIVNYGTSNQKLGGLVGYGDGLQINNSYSATQVLFGNNLQSHPINGTLVSQNKLFWESTTNKGGIISNDENCTTSNTYYVKDFIPYGSRVGDGVPYSILMSLTEWNLSDKFTYSLELEEICYPMLDWIESYAIGMIQSTGTNVRPLSIQSNIDEVFVESSTLVIGTKTVYSLGSSIYSSALELEISEFGTLVTSNNTSFHMDEIYNNGTMYGGKFTQEFFKNTGNIVGGKYNVANITTTGFVYACELIGNNYNSEIHLCYIHNSVVKGFVEFTEGSDITQTIKESTRVKYYFEKLTSPDEMTFDEASNIDTFEAYVDDGIGITQNRANVDRYWTMINNEDYGRHLLPSWLFKDNYYDDELATAYSWIKNENVESVEESGGVYDIANANQLAWVAQQVCNGANVFEGKTINLMNDIDLSGKLWTPIGTSANPFEGKFNGNGHTIDYMYVMGNQDNGLFGAANGSTENQVEIKNLMITNAQVGGYDDDSNTAILIGSSTGKNLKIFKVAIEDAHVAGCRTAGMIGSLTPEPGELNTTIEKSYVVIAEGSGNSIKGNNFRFIVKSPAKIVDDKVVLDEVYGAELEYVISEYEINEEVEYGLCTLDVQNAEGQPNCKYILTNKSSSLDGIKKNYNAMKTEELAGFDWGIDWARETDTNWGLPVLTFTMQYWIDDGKALCGTENEPKYDEDTNYYLISSVEELAWIAYQVNELGNSFAGIKFKISDTIKDNKLDMIGKLWSPIGTASHPFQGTFIDAGTSLTINNMTSYGTYYTFIDSETGERKVERSYGGLFGYIANGNINQKFNFYNVMIRSVQYAGALAGRIALNNSFAALEGEGTFAGLDNITLQKIDIIGTYYVGGYIGYIANTSTSKVVLNNIYLTDASGVELSVSDNIEFTGSGGIVGSAQGITISNSIVESAYIKYSINSGVSTMSYTGGIAGQVNNSTIFNNKVVSTIIEGEDCVGGIVGQIGSGSKLYSAYVAGGSIHAKGAMGGIAGSADSTNTILQNLTIEEFSFYAQDSLAIVGGVVGSLNGATLSEAKVASNISLNTSITPTWFGGIVGRHMSGRIINVQCDYYDKYQGGGDVATYGHLVGQTNDKEKISMAVLNIPNMSYTGALINNESTYNYDNDSRITIGAAYKLLDSTSTDAFKFFLYSNSWTMELSYPRTLTLKQITNPNMVSKFYMTGTDGSEVVPYSASDLYEDDGFGTKVYRVEDYSDLNYLANYIKFRKISHSNVYVKIMNDFEIKGIYTPIGVNMYYPFNGILDGNSKIITFGGKINSYHVQSNGNKYNMDIGLIGYATKVEAKNITLRAKANNYGLISDEAKYVGGIVGQLASTGASSFENCTTNIQVQGKEYVGGLIGSAVLSSTGTLTIKNSTYSYVMSDAINVAIYAPIIAEASYAGGLVGYAKGVSADNKILIETCTTQGQIAALSIVGGFVGAGEYVDIKGCTAKPNYQPGTGGSFMYNVMHKVGSSTDNAFAGGIIGQVLNSTTSNCILDMPSIVYDTTVANTTATGRYVGGVAGHATDCTISDCKYDEKSTTSNDPNKGRLYSGNAVGGIVGGAKDCTIENCATNNKVRFMPVLTSTTDNVGGIVGVVRDIDDTDVVTGKTIIKNCTNQANITGNKNVGGIVGSVVHDDLEITNCKNEVTTSGTEIKGVISGNENVGGILGYIGKKLTMTNCNNSGDVQDILQKTIIDGIYIGGILGYFDNSGTNAFTSTITNCDNTGNVGGLSATNVGGIIGKSYEHGLEITDCDNSGEITAKDTAGGIIAYFYGSTTNKVKISNCTNTASVTTNTTIKTDSDGKMKTSYVGGLIGSANYAVIENNTVGSSASRISIKGVSYVGGLVGGTYNYSEIKGNTVQYSDIYADANAGGIAGNVGNNVTYDKSTLISSLKSSVTIWPGIADDNLGEKATVGDVWSGLSASATKTSTDFTLSGCANKTYGRETDTNDDGIEEVKIYDLACDLQIRFLIGNKEEAIGDIQDKTSPSMAMNDSWILYTFSKTSSSFEYDTNVIGAGYSNASITVSVTATRHYAVVSENARQIYDSSMWGPEKVEYDDDKEKEKITSDLTASGASKANILVDAATHISTALGEMITEIKGKAITMPEKA